MSNITSRDNSLLRRARAVRDGKVEDTIFVEGLRLCEEALSSGLRIEGVIYAEPMARKQRVAHLIEGVGNVCPRVAAVSEELLFSISDTTTPQGIVMLAERPVTAGANFKAAQPSSPLILVIHAINNPANTGALLRTAEAAGATGAITTTRTSDAFSSKALRGAMGSAFRLPIWAGASFSKVIAWCAVRKIRTICADLRASKLYTEVDWRGSCALIVGPEATGLSVEEVAAASESVRLPMHGAVESLNVAVAAGILLYEAARQRKG